MSQDWKEPREDYERTLGGLRTGSEVLADLEYEQDEIRDRLLAHGPAFCEGYPCGGCGAYLKVSLSMCPLCGAERRKAA